MFIFAASNLLIIPSLPEKVEAAIRRSAAPNEADVHIILSMNVGELSNWKRKIKVLSFNILGAGLAFEHIY